MHALIVKCKTKYFLFLLLTQSSSDASDSSFSGPKPLAIRLLCFVSHRNKSLMLNFSLILFPISVKEG